MSTLAPVMEGFFTERLIGQRRASPHTVASYRDCFRLLLGFAHQHTGKPPSTLRLADLDAVMIGAFLDHLEAERHNSVRTRNNRLAAIHSLFAYAALRHPERFDALVALGIIHPFQRPSIGSLLNAWRGVYQAFLASPVIAETALRSSPVLVAEAILTAFFLYIILGATDERAPVGFAPIAIGLGLTLIHLISIPISNTSVNPARSTAVAFFNGNGAPGQLWAFWVAPLVGAAIAGATYHLVTGIDRRDEDITGMVDPEDLRPAT